jgi:hypothetical protein
VNPSEIYGRTAVQYDSNSVWQSNVYEWAEKFEGWINIDYMYSQWPVIVTCMEIKEQLDQRIQDNRRTTLMITSHG